MFINEEACRVFCISNVNYLNYCKLLEINPKELESKRRFFLDIKHGRVYRIKESGEVFYGKEVI